MGRQTKVCPLCKMPMIDGEIESRMADFDYWWDVEYPTCECDLYGKKILLPPRKKTRSETDWEKYLKAHQNSIHYNSWRHEVLKFKQLSFWYDPSYIDDYHKWLRQYSYEGYGKLFLFRPDED